VGSQKPAQIWYNTCDEDGSTSVQLYACGWQLF
jgi:hypothetical protein